MSGPDNFLDPVAPQGVVPSSVPITIITCSAHLLDGWRHVLDVRHLPYSTAVQIQTYYGDTCSMCNGPSRWHVTA